MQVIEEAPVAPRRGAVVRAILLVAIVAMVAGGAAWWGIASRARAMTVLTRETREVAIPTVAVVRPRRGAPQEELVLPGNMLAFTDAPVYARTSGYLRKRVVDMGSRVKQGQLLAEIDAPELDQQLQQARADLATAEANLRVAQITADRYLDLRKTDSVSEQDADNAVGTLEARKAAALSAKHNVQRLEQLLAFTRIYAPFDGVVTARNTEVGALIDPGASGGAARELFHVAATDRLRVFVNVPERHARLATPGLQAELTLTEFPGRRFTGVLARTARAIDVASRTLLAEFEVGNPSGELLPGSYAEVHLKLASAASTSVLPVTTLIFRGAGLQVALVRDDRTVALVPVTLGRDFGTEVEIVAGLNGDEAVVTSPPDSLTSGQRVQVLATAADADRGERR